MPSRFCLPPVEHCRGTTPTQAAKSRPRRKALPFPMAATVAVETSGPEPGNLTALPAARVLITNALHLLRPRLDLNLGLLPFLPHSIQPPAQARGQVLLGIFDDCPKILAPMDGLGRKGDAMFQQQSAKLIDQRRATLPQPVPYPVHGLPVELLLVLNLHKAHVLLGHGFGNRFGVKEVVLDELCRDQPHLVSLLPQHRPQRVRSRACLQTD